MVSKSNMAPIRNMKVDDGQKETKRRIKISSTLLDRGSKVAMRMCFYFFSTRPNVGAIGKRRKCGFRVFLRNNERQLSQVNFLFGFIISTKFSNFAKFKPILYLQ